MNEAPLDILTIYEAVEDLPIGQHVLSITNIVCSPKMKYVATWSHRDKLVYRWLITEEKLKFDNHYIIDNSIDAKALIGISDENHIILSVEKNNLYNFGETVIKTGRSYQKPAQISIYSVENGILMEKRK
ncbi:23251_t:CDS:2 [Cetraspora pellucida]|uniref:23251_t:CDS:1 n=1 Tax=Cetraspora pellucida TaxID=1433469 RepID=A0A9N9CBN2_9GLOM|nr:23251_t:CDS:2 [Cetraspora pellucida]